MTDIRDGYEECNGLINSDLDEFILCLCTGYCVCQDFLTLFFFLFKRLQYVYNFNAVSTGIYVGMKILLNYYIMQSI